MSTFIDVLVAGIGGAAGRRADMLHEEVSLLRKHSLAQLQEQSGGGKGSMRAIDADALSAVDWLHGQGIITDDMYEVVGNDPDAAMRLVRRPDIASQLTAATDFMTEEARVGTGQDVLTGQRDAARTRGQELSLPHERLDAAQTAYVTLRNQDRDIREPNWNDAGEVERFLNRPEVRAVLDRAEDAESIYQEGRFNIPEGKAAMSVREDVAEVRGGLDAGLFSQLGTARGKERVGEHQEMERAGIRDADIDDVAPIPTLINDASSAVIDDSIQFWRQETPASNYARDVVNQYFTERADELMEQGLPRNQIQNQLFRESAQLRRMDLESMASGAVRTGREAQETGSQYDRSQIERGIQEIRSTILEGEQPREAPTPAPTDTESPVIGTLMDDSPSVTGDDVPEMLARPEAPVAPRGATPEVSEDGRVSLSPSGSVIGHELEIIETAANVLRQGMESDDPQERSRSEANALRLIAENTTSVQRNGLSPQQYLSALRQQIIEGR